MMAANVVALDATTTDGLGTAFVLVGLHQAAVHVSSLNIFLEFAPADEERPTYVGLGSTSVAPFAFASPLLAGLAADALGLRVVFWVATGFGLAALLVLWARVRDPRHARLDRARSAG
jgi:MFS family permease